MSHSAIDTVHVYDTWVKGTKGTIHFDVMTTDEATALKLAKEYLAGIGEADAVITTKECRLCHSEPLVMFSAEQQKQFREKGGFIIPLPA
jgi:heterodisulfide reductase subunit B